MPKKIIDRWLAKIGSVATLKSVTDPAGKY